MTSRRTWHVCTKLKLSGIIRTCMQQVLWRTRKVGLVRCYKYHHPDGTTCQCNTGVNADYWSTSDGGGGYWRALITYLEKNYEVSYAK